MLRTSVVLLCRHSMTNSMWELSSFKTATERPRGESPPRRSGWSCAWRRPFPRSAPRSRPGPPGRWKTPGTGVGVLDVLQHQIPILLHFLHRHRIPSFPFGGLPPQIPGREWNRYWVHPLFVFGSLISLYLILRAFRIRVIQIRVFRIW